MISFQRFSMIAAGTLLLGSAAYAQSVVSAKSGLIHYTEGDVLLQDKAVETNGVKFQDMKNGDVLRTQEGRAEVLLTPGSVLWMKEQTSVKMVSNRLAHTAVEVLSGSVVVECPEVAPGTEVVLTFKDTTVEFAKKGIVRIDTDPAAVKVYSGEAIVTRGNDTLTLKEGKQTTLAGVLQPEKFDNKVGDSFYRWAARRDAGFAAANLAAAKSAGHSVSYPKIGGTWGWNPWLGMFTYIPYSGRYFSPFGFAYFSPYSVGSVYDSYYYGGGGRYYGGGGNNATSNGLYNSALGYGGGGRASTSYSSGVATSVGSSSSVSSGGGAVSSGRGGDAGGGSTAVHGGGGGGGGGRGGR